MWQARYTDPITGERRNAPTTYKRKSQADAFIASVRTDLDRGLRHDFTAGKVRLGDWCDTWLAGRSDIRPRTRETHANNINRHIKPELGHVPLNALTPALVREWNAGRVATGHETAAAQAYRTLATIMRSAVDDRLIPASPCTMKAAGKTVPKKVRALSKDELRRVADAIDDRYRAMVMVAGTCGLRWGEMLGLTTDDFTAASRRLRVERQMVETKGSFEVGHPKTNRSRRVVVLPSTVAIALKDHIDTYCPDGGYLFLTSKGTHPHRSNFSTHFWQPALRDAGVDHARFHDLRHTAASLLIDAGANPLVVQHRLGHQNISTTLGAYGHLMEHADESAADTLDDVFA